MSESIVLPGAGDAVAVDLVAGLAFQRVKLDLGGDGASAPVAGALPVSVAALPLPVGAATEATLATLAAATKIEDTPGANGDRGILILAQRVDTDGPTAGNDGDYTAVKTDEAGRLKVAVQPGGYPLTVGTITSALSTVPLNVARVSNVLVYVAGTFAGVSFVFEGSLDSTNGTDGTWFGLQAVRTNANTIEASSGALSAPPAYGWELSVNGLNWFRVRSTAWTSGTANVQLQPGAYATEPIPAAQVSATQPVSPVTTNVRLGYYAASGIWYDDSSTALAANATFTGTARDAALSLTGALFAGTNTAMMEVRAVAESDVAGTLWLEISRDNTTWRRLRSVATAAVTGGGQVAEISYRHCTRYWRIGYTNGATAQARFLCNTVAMAA